MVISNPTLPFYRVVCYLPTIQASMFKAGVKNGILPLVYNVSNTSDISVCVNVQYHGVSQCMCVYTCGLFIYQHCVCYPIYNRNKYLQVLTKSPYRLFWKVICTRKWPLSHDTARNRYEQNIHLSTLKLVICMKILSCTKPLFALTNYFKQNS